jgi:hypothetical protein
MAYRALVIERHKGHQQRRCPHSRSNKKRWCDMPMYQFLFLADDRSLSNAEVLECGNDREAIDKAHELCANHTVEAWIDRRRIFSVASSASGGRSSLRKRRSS